MNQKSVGLIELSSIAAGFSVADSALKAGNVKLMLSRSICSGKYMILLAGDTASVEAAIATGNECAGGCLIDHVVIANLHPDVLSAIGRTTPVEPTGALGIFESFNVATLIKAADAAAKAADVQLLEVRLAMALGGKAFCTLTGDVVQRASRRRRRPRRHRRSRRPRERRCHLPPAPGCVSRGDLTESKPVSE